MHQREQRERLGCLAYRMFRQDERKPYRFITKLSTDRQLRVGRKVTFGEQQIQYLAYRRQPDSTLFSCKVPNAERIFAQSAARPAEALVYIGLAREQPKRDLIDVEAAKGLQCQYEL
jgi:hypothetical protein